MTASEASISADRIHLGYGPVEIINALSTTIEHGEITALVGPNGSGKSTLLKGLARLIKTNRGSVLLDGKAISQYTTAEVARRLAVLPQGPGIPEALTVRELVEQGRFPHVGALRMLRQQDHIAIDNALKLTKMTDFVQRPLDTLSGGERQRAWIALALAQMTPLLLLDEPTTFLDLGHQLEILSLVERLNREQKITILLVLHDLNQAARYAHRIIVMKSGQIVADGSPENIITADILRDVFRVEAQIIRDPLSGSLICLPIKCME
jgi:iron complex transport system ATP-binding protein